MLIDPGELPDELITSTKWFDFFIFIADQFTLCLNAQVPYDEKEILQLIAAGDAAAFHRLVDAYWKKVYGHAISYMKSPYNAQELTQDVFVKIWQQREQLTGIGHFKNYLFILSRNQIISAIRKKLRETTLEEDFDVLETMPQPDQQLQYKEVMQWINKGIDALPPMRQQVFRMSRMQGMTHEEIAQQLGIARNTVKQHIVLALNSLREHLRQYTDLAPILIAFIFLDH